MDPTRRGLLGGVALFVALAGCLGDDETDDDDPVDDEAPVEPDDDPEMNGVDDETADADEEEPDDSVADDDDVDAAAHVNAEGTVFDPNLVFIEPGETVEWTQVDGQHTVTTYHQDNGVPHRVAADDALLDHDFADATSVTFTFETAGVYDYFCRPHEGMGMVGRVVVGEPTADEPGLAEPQDELPDGAASAIRELNEAVRAEFELDDPDDADDEPVDDADEDDTDDEYGDDDDADADDGYNEDDHDDGEDEPEADDDGGYGY